MQIHMRCPRCACHFHAPGDLPEADVLGCMTEGARVARVPGGMRRNESAKLSSRPLDGSAAPVKPRCIG